ncbi:MAG: glycosyltransferase family 4 protein [Elusimicrobia bacterium]|nr:glycosyltransferase family 4 protein [Elusimicrobiota bacterium]
MPPPLLLFVVTEDWYFCSHRLPLARAAKAAGFRVAVATRVQDHRERILAEGFELHEIPALQRGLGGWREPRTLLALIQLYRRLRPAAAVHVALKPVVIAGLAARIAGPPPILNIMTGFGFLFTSRSLKAALLRRPITAVLRAVIDRPGSTTIVQNDEDRELLFQAVPGAVSRSALVRGSGVDCERFTPLPEPAGPFTAAAVCRMLGDKGVRDLVEAGRLLRRRGQACRILLVGPTDPLNPTAIPERELRAWTKEGVVEWLGPREDVKEVWRMAHAAVLPSHREGLPKALIEAAACGRPIIATDTTGCKEVVEHGKNGLLVPLRDPSALADALQALARDPEGRRRMGAAGRLRVEERYAEGVVVSQSLELIERLVG